MNLKTRNLKTRIIRAMLFWTWDLFELACLALMVGAVIYSCDAFAHHRLH